MVLLHPPNYLSNVLSYYQVSSKYYFTFLLPAFAIQRKQWCLAMSTNPKLFRNKYMQFLQHLELTVWDQLLINCQCWRCNRATQHNFFDLIQRLCSVYDNVLTIFPVVTFLQWSTFLGESLCQEWKQKMEDNCVKEDTGWQKKLVFPGSHIKYRKLQTKLVPRDTKHQFKLAFNKIGFLR